MLIYLLADLHGKNALLDEVCSQMNQDDFLFIAGDITHFGDESKMQGILNKWQAMGDRIAAVHGNCDLPGAAHWLAQSSMGIHEKTRKLDGLVVFGLGGSLPCPGSTPSEFSEEQFEEKFSHLQDSEVSSLKPLAFLLHQPPYDTKVDSLYSGEKVGSHAIREAVLQYKPLFCLSGHIHESQAIDYLGDTILINPGPAMDGNFAIYNRENGEVSLEKK